MSKEYRVSSTYIRLMILADSTLVAHLSPASRDRLQNALEQDFLSGTFVNQLFNELAENGIESLALRFGEQMSVANHGPVGFAAISAPDLVTALSVFSEFADTRVSATAIEVRMENNHLQYILRDNSDNPLAERWLTEAVFVAAQSLIETIMAHKMGDQAYFQFAYEKPIYHQQIAKIFNAPCRYNAPESLLCIPASWAQIQSPLHDQEAYLNNLAKSRELKLRLNADQTDVRHLVTTRLLNHFDHAVSQTTRDFPVPDLADLADELCMSTRTLMRHLANKNTSYKQILAEIRLQQAQNMLRTTHLTVSEIAQRLGYLEAANFSRAFHRWTGKAPGVWRRMAEK